MQSKLITRTLAPLALGALLAGLVGLSACSRQSSSSSLFAADAHAATVATAPAVLASAPTAAAPSGDRQLGPMPSLSPLVKLLRPLVVNIATTTKSKAVARRRGRTPRGQRTPQPQPMPFGDGPSEEGDGSGGGGGGDADEFGRFFHFFGGPNGRAPDMRAPERHGLGSGFTIGDGLVLTNNHVVEGADEIKVTTDPTAPGGTREFTGKVIGRDAQTDIALVLLDGDRAKQLPAATLGSSDALEVGDYVIAIGEPFGFQATVTSGIVSAKERSLRSSPFDDFIQTDASINPGNSGGPLFNLKGEVVGVNTAIINGANSIGFAIPIDLIKQELPQLREKGRVTRGYLGVQVQPVTQEMAEGFGRSTTEGALVARVEKGAPAFEAGLKAGDIITGVNGKLVRDERHLTRTIASYPPGAQVKLGVFRDKSERDVALKVGTRPDEPDEADPKGERGEQGDKQVSDPLGLQVEDITPDLARRAQIEPGTHGAIITDVAPDSPASQAVEPGDVVVELNRKPIDSAEDYRKAVKGLKKGDLALVRTVSRGSARYQTIRLK